MASLSMTVDAPRQWSAVSNGVAVAAPALDAASTRHRFKTTDPLAPHLFAVHAGPYQSTRTEHSGIPLGVYCRPEMIGRLSVDGLFDSARQALDFYGDYYGRPYAFGKLDFVFAPGFALGGMENAGAVTLEETYALLPGRGKERAARIGNVVLHEIGHMWLGNLATMEWWDDVWLNEGVATYLSDVARNRSPRRLSALGGAGFPLGAAVPDTDAAMWCFAPSMYSQASRLIHDLATTVGADVLREGLRALLASSAGATWTRSDFYSSLRDLAGPELWGWAEILLHAEGALHGDSPQSIRLHPSANRGS